MIKGVYKKLIPETRRLEVRYFINRLKATFYKGDRYHCNCCNHSFSAFLTKGNTPRENAECPLCGSLERTRLLLYYLQNETSIFSNSCSLLHIAPERALTPIFQKHKNIVYIDGDINPAYATNIIDITKIDCADDYFDYIICAHVLGHVPSEALAIRELNRVLKKDGTALVMTLLSHNFDTLESSEVTTEQQRLLHYGEHDLCRLHGLDFAARLGAQFNVESIDYRKKFSTQEQLRFSLGNGIREIIFKCTKK